MKICVLLSAKSPINKTDFKTQVQKLTSVFIFTFHLASNSFLITWVIITYAYLIINFDYLNLIKIHTKHI